LDNLTETLKNSREKLEEFLNELWWIREKPPLIKVKEAKIEKGKIEFTTRERYIPRAIEILEKNLQLSKEIKDEKIKAKIVENVFNDFLYLKKFTKNLITAKELIERLEASKEKIDQIKALPGFQKQLNIISKTMIKLIFKIRNLAVEGKPITHITSKVEEIEKTVEKIHRKTIGVEEVPPQKVEEKIKPVETIELTESADVIVQKALTSLKQFETLLSGKKYYEEILKKLNNALRTGKIEFSVKDVPEQYIEVFINLYQEYKLKYDPNTKTIKITN